MIDIYFKGNLRDGLGKNERSGSIGSNNGTSIRQEQQLQSTHGHPRHSLSLHRGASSSSTSDNNSDASATYTDSEPSRHKPMDVANGTIVIYSIRY